MISSFKLITAREPISNLTLIIGELFIGGFSVNSPGGGDGSGFNSDGTAGTIVEGGTATVTFDVTVD